MGKIKSALELAMEKTEDLKIDLEAFHRDEMNKEGKKTLSRFLNGEIKDVKEAISHFNKEDKKMVTMGFMESLLANLTLINRPEEMNKLEPLYAGLLEISSDENRTAVIIKQVRMLMTQYLDAINQLTDGLKKQYEPQLRQKERQLQQQTGQSVKITHEKDPEFLRILADQLAAMDQQFREVLKQAKDEFKKNL